MDAITKQQTLTGVLVTLLVGSAFAGVVIPTAQAGAFTTGATDAILDGGDPQSVVFNGTTYTNTSLIIAPSSGGITYNTTYDLVITNISTTGSLPSGYAYTTTTTGLYLLRPDFTCQTTPCNTRPTTLDGTGGNHPSGNVNVTFPAFTPDAAGLWTLRDATNTTVTRIFVMPASVLTVALSASAFSAGSSAQAFTITVSPVTTGQTVVINSTSLLDAQTIGGTAAGTASYTFVGPLAQAGTFTVYATREIYNATNEFAAASGLPTHREAPELQGTANLVVGGAALAVTAVDKTVRSGFTENASFDIQYPNGTYVFANAVGSGSTLNLGFIYANISITTPTASKLWYNVSSNATGLSSSTSACAPTTFVQDPVAALGADIHNSSLIAYAALPGFCTGNTTAQALAGGVWQFSDGGRLYFRPASTWNGGTYTISVVVNTAGSLTAGSGPEFSGSTTLTTTAPATINLKVLNATPGGAGEELKNLTGQSITFVSGVPTFGTCTAGDTLVTPCAGYALSLQILGPTATTYPTSAAPDTFVAANVSVSGDILPLPTGSIVPVVSSGNVVSVSINNVIPTSVNGQVTMVVTWAGTTGTITLPIVKGAVSTANVGEITVDSTSTVTITLKDKFGNIAPHGQVFLVNLNGGLYSGVGPASVNGTGDVGVGGSGQYTFNIKPTAVGNLVAFGIIGSIENGVDNRNYTYVNVRVVPAHDVTTTLSATSTMASKTTALFINATTSDGVGLATTGASAVKIYFLTDKQYSDFQANGSNSLPQTLATACCYPVAAGNNFGTVSLGTFSTAGFNLNVTLLNGTYHVYIASTDGKHDNNQSVPTFTVNKFHAVFTPAQIANNPNVQSNQAINVTITGAGNDWWNGTLNLNTTNTNALHLGNLTCLATGASVTTCTTTVATAITITNGGGSFIATGKDIGAINFDFDPAGSTAAPAQSPVDTQFQIVGPNVVVSPDRVPVGTPTTVSVTVKSLNGTGLADIWVTMCGSPIVTNGSCTGGVLTDANGFAQVGFVPQTNGIINLYVNNASTPTIVTVFSGLVIGWTPQSPVQNDTVTITVTQLGSTVGLSGVTVSIEKSGVAVSGFPQTTTSNGQVVLPSVQQGTYNVTAAKAGFQNGTAQIVVGAPTVTPPAKSAKFELANLIAPSTGTVGSALTASADLKNIGEADGTATVLLLVNGAVRDSRSIPVNAGGKETVAFDFTPTTAGAFKVTVKLSTGETLAEKTVTVTTPPTTTPTTTTTTTTTTSTPPTTTTTTTTSTPPATTPTPKVPGFEVVALVGALAVAMLVLRSRRS
ncbi:MAG: CARDB domain-containing protein [Candidatus Thermoplasmatota archaeon]